jgi:hypothetical protein
MASAGPTPPDERDEFVERLRGLLKLLPGPVRVYVRAERERHLFRLPAAPPPAAALPFVPNAVQDAILLALKGKALRTDSLAKLVGGRGRLFQRPGGIKELQERGLVDHHDRIGFYSVEFPPEELGGDPEATGAAPPPDPKRPD